jgi:hypothetical protein
LTEKERERVRVCKRERKREEKEKKRERERDRDFRRVSRFRGGKTDALLLFLLVPDLRDLITVEAA